MCFFSPLGIQGAQVLYGTVVRPVFANLNGKSNLAPTQSEPTVADGLRERVASAE